VIRAFFAALALAAVPSSGGASPVENGLPPYVEAYQPQGTDERGIWMLADEDERVLRDSKFIISDPAIRNYVASVLCRTVGNDRCRGVRIYVLRVAAFNANMAPNGTMQVWSGLLLRVRSEAELAAVLGHEFAHFELRHGLAGYRQQRTMQDIAAWAGLLGGQYAVAIQQGAIGSMYQFSREQERQADLLSLKYLKQSPYSAQASAHIWQRLMDESDATALGRKQKSSRYNRVPFFATHPTNLERATYLAALAKDEPEKPEGEGVYVKALGRWRLQFLADQLRLNDFGGTEYLLAQLAKSGWTPDLLFARGELYRMRGQPRDLVTAADFYRAAVVGQPDLADAYRGLGLALLRSDSREEGSVALRRYLLLNPSAPDAAMLSSLISN
jgi:predicted Zn-dependent protease